MSRSHTVTASEAKQRFAEVLDKSASGPVSITLHGKIRAVVLSGEAYAALTEPSARLDRLAGKYRELIARMQSQEQTEAADVLMGRKPKVKRAQTTRKKARLTAA